MAMRSTPRQSICSLNQAALQLGVSTATIRNWVKAKQLAPIEQRPMSFRTIDIEEFRKSITSGDVARLRTRANKSRSDETSIPREYIISPQTSGLIDSVLTIFASTNKSVDVSAAVFTVALRVFELRGEVQSNNHGIHDNLANFTRWKRNSIRNEMFAWYSSLKSKNICKQYYKLEQLPLHAIDEDILGLVYQSLSSEGEKSTKGSYYTPREIVEASLNCNNAPVTTFLDPSCGTGQYLICAARSFELSLRNVFGFDVDELAVRIARCNLLLSFPKEDVRPRIECFDSITELATNQKSISKNCLANSIDFIASNPPWGAYKNSKRPDTLINGICSNEAFSLILARSIELLRNGGKLSFVLPESILNIRAHADIRKIILEKTKIERIVHLGRPFSGVFTRVVRLDIIKEPATDNSLVEINTLSKYHQVYQKRFHENYRFRFDIHVTKSENDIIKRIYETNFITLKDNAVWALGIVTGNNKELLSSDLKDGQEPIYKGSDLAQFVIRPASNFISFDRERLQQVAKVEFYRAPAKLIYKFISTKLVFAYDDQQRLTLNSANILIPTMPGVSIKVVLAILNSRMFQYLNFKMFATHKVLRGDLETLPFVVDIERAISAKLELLVDQITNGADKAHELNRIVYNLYGLDKKEISQIEKVVCQ